MRGIIDIKNYGLLANGNFLFMEKWVITWHPLVTVKKKLKGDFAYLNRTFNKRMFCTDFETVREHIMLLTCSRDKIHAIEYL